ncbi:MAG: type II toxin-antitoxin system RelE/ParE family toxin [Gammaproteobacteria bacterium]
MGVLFTPRAEMDLEEIGDYIAQDNPARALTFIQEIRAQCQKIGKSPLAYRARPELGDEIRSCPFGNYVILFCPQALDVLIVRVLHGAMDLPRHMGNEDS